jgi:hypothetical protein
MDEETTEEAKEWHSIRTHLDCLPLVEPFTEELF